MGKIKVELIESSEVNQFSVDFSGVTECQYQSRCGILTRELGPVAYSNSQEIGKLDDAHKYLAKNFTKTGFHKLNPIPTQFSPGKILRQNDRLVEFLRSDVSAEWKIVFRISQTHRLISGEDNTEQTNHFLYHSLLINLKLKDQREPIEVGEGNVNSLKFNIDGIQKRITDIYSSHKSNRKTDLNRRMPVILQSGDGGILFHEILGHSLEADYVADGLSPFSLEDLGKKIMSAQVNIVTFDPQDKFFKNITCDDEGARPGSATLVEDGILRNFISDITHQKLLNLPHAGNSRIENFLKIPMPRMFALYLKPGKHPPDDLVASTRYGIYAKEFGEGKVLFNKNLFFFRINEAHLIENGKITAPLGSITVSGDILQTLNSIDMIADDFRYDKGISYCFKNGQTINVRVGQPTVKIDNLFVSTNIDD